MSYARARLWLGISGVGTIVVVSACLLFFQVPSHLLTVGKASFGSDIRLLVGILFAYAVLSGPFDFFGGYILPTEYGRTAVRFPVFLRGWLRGVLLHSLILLGIALTLLYAVRTGGFPLFLGAFVCLNLLLLSLQPLMAILLGGITYKRPTPEQEKQFASLSGGRKRLRMIFAVHTGPYFTGGIAGLPGRERLIVPAAWIEALSSAELETVCLRKTGILQSGSRTRGLLLAIGWNTICFCLAGLLTGDLTSVAGLVTFSLWFTMGSFLGLLILPVPSQRGVFEGDTFALQHGAPRMVLENLLRKLDRDQDDEPSRTRSIETCFHPLPSVERRLAFLDTEGQTQTGAWHGARMAIYLSWAGGSFLSRAVHCNCGRPDVWVFLPSD